MAYLQIAHENITEAEKVLKEIDVMIEAIWFDPLDCFMANEAEIRISEYEEHHGELSEETRKKVSDRLNEELLNNSDYIINSDAISSIANEVLEEMVNE